MVVSNHRGDRENLGRVFDRPTPRLDLFFDEADSLFGKRTVSRTPTTGTRTRRSVSSCSHRGIRRRRHPASNLRRTSTTRSSAGSTRSSQFAMPRASSGCIWAEAMPARAAEPARPGAYGRAVRARAARSSTWCGLRPCGRWRAANRSSSPRTWRKGSPRTAEGGAGLLSLRPCTPPQRWSTGPRPWSSAPTRRPAPDPALTLHVAIRPGHCGAPGSARSQRRRKADVPHERGQAVELPPDVTVEEAAHLEAEAKAAEKAG